MHGLGKPIQLYVGTNNMKFDDLKLYSGFPLQLQLSALAGQAERYSCRLIGSLPGRSILLSVPKITGKLIKLRAGQKIIVRLMVDNGIGVFASQIEAQTSEPYPILHISYPEIVTFKGIRGATRVGVDQQVVAHNLNPDKKGDVRGVIVDISITGARLETETSLGDIGDHCELIASVIVQDVMREWRCKAVIRSRVDAVEDIRNPKLSLSYGIEFVDMDEECRLVMYAFVYSQMAIQENHS